MNTSKFDFYEIVKIFSNIENKKFLNGKFGTIIGKAEPETELCHWSYGVDILEEECIWWFNEDELECTGKFDNPEKFKPAGIVKVFVSSSGEGFLKEKDQDEV